MKTKIALMLLAAAMAGLVAIRPWMAVAQTPVFQVEEFATIRWDGRDNTHVIRPNGKTEFLGQMWGTTPRPNRTDERAFYLNVAMNALAKEGYQFAGRTENEIVMKRALPK